MKMRSPPLFWRTLLLVLLLILRSLAAWLQSFGYSSAHRAPRPSRSRLSRSPSSRGRHCCTPILTSAANLLAELARNEGIRIAPLETSDRGGSVSDRPVLRLAEQSIIAKLGPARASRRWSMTSPGSG